MLHLIFFAWMVYSAVRLREAYSKDDTFDMVMQVGGEFFAMYMVVNFITR